MGAELREDPREARAVLSRYRALAPSQGGGMLLQRCGWLLARLLARLERVLPLLELSGSVEEGGCVQPLGFRRSGTSGSAASEGWES